MSKDNSFGILWNFETFDSGFFVNLFTIFRFGCMVGNDVAGEFIQFNFGIYRLALTLQFGIDK
tara:strand:- start:236 stop:424 length:189 start_codon:yes stop_codon:yes gene_type:complete